MATGPALLVISCSALCVLCMADLTCGQCITEFKFPGVNNTTTTITPSTTNLTSTATTTSDITLRRQKGSMPNVHFSLDSKDCSKDTVNRGDFIITIRVQDLNKEGIHYVHFCKIMQCNGTCCPFGPKECGCVEGSDANYFLRTDVLNSTDEIKWRLAAVTQDQKVMAKATVNLVLEYVKENNDDAEDGADAGDDERKTALIVAIVISAVFILLSVIMLVVLARRKLREDNDAMIADPNDRYPKLLPLPPPLPAADAEDDREDSVTSNADADYLYPIPSLLTPPSAAGAEDDREDSVTSYADADYLHPILSLPKPPPEDVDQCSGHIYQSPSPRNKTRLPSSNLLIREGLTT